MHAVHSSASVNKVGRSGGDGEDADDHDKDVSSDEQHDEEKLQAVPEIIAMFDKQVVPSEEKINSALSRATRDTWELVRGLKNKIRMSVCSLHYRQAVSHRQALVAREKELRVLLNSDIEQHKANQNVPLWATVDELLTLVEEDLTKYRSVGDSVDAVNDVAEFQAWATEFDESKRRLIKAVDDSSSTGDVRSWHEAVLLLVQLYRGAHDKAQEQERLGLQKMSDLCVAASDFQKRELAWGRRHPKSINLNAVKRVIGKSSDKLQRNIKNAVQALMKPRGERSTAADERARLQSIRTLQSQHLNHTQQLLREVSSASKGYSGVIHFSHLAECATIMRDALVSQAKPVASLHEASGLVAELQGEGVIGEASEAEIQQYDFPDLVTLRDHQVSIRRSMDERSKSAMQVFAEATSWLTLTLAKYTSAMAAMAEAGLLNSKEIGVVIAAYERLIENSERLLHAG
eukprot:TRINITY_DN66812_c0_g2_i1.p1 TRINITY_DN66812_c0_g2~~TRINITY_DN66812_c0_g2_i1.p1  ORF type:complete len:536 (-),score=210.28 TRINITY_DN66812_c0_g2_i1:489-1868(-)